MDNIENLPRIEKNSDTQLVGKGEETPYYVVLPCEVKDFRQFVSGLLGKPQELRGELEGTFTIGHREISNIYHLLEQRMAKQNDASLVHFAITVYYNDGNSVVHNNVRDFESYHPTTKCYATGVATSATYLIKFRGHETPEKQEIEVYFAIDPEFRRDYPRWFEGGIFEYRIVHTERTWATDIAGLLANHGATVVEKVHGFKHFIRTYGDQIAIYFSQIVVLVSVFVWAGVALNTLSQTTADLQSIKAFVGFGIRSIAALVLLGVVLGFVRTYVESTAFFGRGSGILFTDDDRKRYAVIAGKKTWGMVRYVGVQGLSLVSGVVSNIIYSKNLFW